MEEALLSVLAADAGVAALVADRIAWASRPQSDGLPAIVLHRITGAQDYHMQGRSGLVESLVQIDCWATTWLAAKTLARAVTPVLDSLTADPFQAAFLVGERDDFEIADGTAFYRTALDVRIWHSAAA